MPAKARSAASPGPAVGAFAEFLSRDMALVALAFVVLFKFTDALSGAMTAPFVIDLGFSRNEYAAIIKGVGLAATLIGGFAGGFVARAYSLPASLLIGGVLQAVANLAFSWQAVVGPDAAWLTFAIVAENFTSAIGTVIFVAYLSALCRNPLHTATQYALLTALAAVRPHLSVVGSGLYRGRDRLGLVLRVCALAGLPALVLLAWLHRRGHFDGLSRTGTSRWERLITFRAPVLDRSRGGSRTVPALARVRAHKAARKRTGRAQKTRKKVFL